jgi:hypothetical protein
MVTVGMGYEYKLDVFPSLPNVAELSFDVLDAEWSESYIY